ncbi:MAG: hypothetical protein MJ145_00545 [Clostridia bacterium]|nr:hypothetical protein [Clostridia bacterium]
MVKSLKTLSKRIFIVFILATVVFSTTIGPVFALTQETMNHRIADLETLKDTYFTTDGKKATSNTDSRCLVSNVLAKNDTVRNLIFENKGKTYINKKLPIKSIDLLPRHYCLDYGGKASCDGYSCYGFAQFALWYIYANTCDTNVYTKDIKHKVIYNYANMHSYAKRGDIIRIKGGNYSGHSAIVLSIKSKGVTVLDCNTYDSGIKEYANDKHASRIRVHDINYDGDNIYVSISRGTFDGDKEPDSGEPGSSENIQDEASKLKISNAVYPTEILQGKNFKVGGKITSNYDIKKIKVSIIDKASKEEVKSKELSPEEMVYELNLDNYIKFSSLKAGSYTYKIEATDSKLAASSSKLKSLLSKDFKVLASKITLGQYKTPEPIKLGGSFRVCGLVKSTVKLSKVWVKIKNNKTGKYVISKYACPNATSYKLSNLNSKIKFSKLPVGSYTYYIIAKDKNQTKTLINKKFVVYGNSTMKLSNTPYPVKLKKGVGFVVKGNVISNNVLRFVTVKVLDKNGKEVIRKTVNITSRYAFKYDLFELDSDITISKLKAGKYTYVIKATDYAKTKTLASKSFTITN